MANDLTKTYCPTCGAVASIFLETWEKGKLMQANPPLQDGALPATCTPCREKILNRFNDPDVKAATRGH